MLIRPRFTPIPKGAPPDGDSHAVSGPPSLSALSHAAHRITQMKYGQIHRHHQRTND